MNTYYYKIDIIPETLPAFSREARVLASSADNAMYILNKAVWENFCTDYRILRKRWGDVSIYSPDLISQTDGHEGYFQFIDYEISIDLLLPYTPVNCRADFIDSFMGDL